MTWLAPGWQMVFPIVTKLLLICDVNAVRRRIEVLANIVLVQPQRKLSDRGSIHASSIAITVGGAISLLKISSSKGNSPNRLATIGSWLSVSFGLSIILKLRVLVIILGTTSYPISLILS